MVLFPGSHIQIITCIAYNHMQSLPVQVTLIYSYTKIEATEQHLFIPPKHSSKSNLISRHHNFQIVPNQSLMGSGSHMHFYHDLEPSCYTQTLTTAIMREAKKKKESLLINEKLRVGKARYEVNLARCLKDESKSGLQLKRWREIRIHG